MKEVFFFLNLCSIIEEKYFEKLIKQPLPFDNTEYELRISGTVETDKRVMSFIDPLWGVEVTGMHHRFNCFMPQFFSISNDFPFLGGRDQFEPLTIIFVTDKKDRYIPVS